MSESPKKIKFEAALKKLEKLTEEIERGEIGLEESIAKYEEGMALVGQCREILTRAEQRITELSPTDDGGVRSSEARDEKPE